MRHAILALLLTGCAFTPAHYEWYPAADPLEWYRWEQVERGAGFSLLCGATPPDQDKACVIRLNGAVIKPTDRNIRTGEEYGKRGEGRLCLVLSTLSEDEARNVPDQFWEQSLRDHEVVKHCGKGLNHNVRHGRIG